MTPVQRVCIEHSCGLDMVHRVLISVDKQRHILSVQLDADAEFVRLGAPVYVNLMCGNSSHRLSASVKSRNDRLVQLQLDQKRTRLDKRRARRHPLKMAARVQMQDAQQFEVHLRDISPYGAGFQASHPLETGQTGTLVLTLMGQQLPIQTGFEVRYCLPMDPGCWRVGVRFTQMARVDLMWLKRLFPE